MTTDIDGTIQDMADGDEPVADSPTSRRSFVSKGAIAAAIGAATGMALHSKAQAANGDTMNVGNSDTGTATTRLSGGTTFEVWGGNSAGSASIYGHTANSLGGSLYGVRGQFDGTDEDGAGVYGYHSDTSVAGTGVKGEAATGTGVYGANLDSAGGGTGVHGVTTGTSGGTGVLGESSGTKGYGVRGRALGTQSVGVLGEATPGGGIGVSGSGSRYDFSAAGSGIVHLTSALGTDVGPTSSGATGSIARNADGSLWYCYATNSWQRLAPTTPTGAAPSFTPVTPFRVYDSRRETDGAFAGGENRTISVADSRDVDTYAVVTADAVPAGATAVTGNVVAIGTTDTGFLSINPGGTTAITAATVNWAAGLNIGNAGVFALNGSRELEAVFGPGNGAHMTIDITGYYL